MSGKRTTPADRSRIQKLVLEQNFSKMAASKIVGFSRKIVIKVCKMPRVVYSRRYGCADR